MPAETRISRAAVSRRRLIESVSFAAGLVATGRLPDPAVAGEAAKEQDKAQGKGHDKAQGKIKKADAKYQNRPNGQQRCEICLQFEAPHTCKIVQGTISPHGWCQFFAARENAR